MFGAMGLGVTDDRKCAGHKQAAQIAVTLFAYIAKPVLASTRVNRPPPWSVVRDSRFRSQHTQPEDGTVFLLELDHGFTSALWVFSFHGAHPVPMLVYRPERPAPLDDAPSRDEKSYYESVTCPACTRLCISLILRP